MEEDLWHLFMDFARRMSQVKIPCSGLIKESSESDECMDLVHGFRIRASCLRGFWGVLMWFRSLKRGRGEDVVEIGLREGKELKGGILIDDGS